MKKIILLIASVMLALLVIEEKGLLNVHALPDTSSVNEITEVAHAKKSILGTAFTPANIPRSTPKDVENFFNLAALIGSNVILIPDWAEDMKIDNIRTVMAMAHAKGMKFHVQLSPISLYGGRKTPSIPKIVTGKSFGQQTVRQAFKTKILELAALKPDLLGLGTEVNFLVQDPSEFKHYVSLTKEAYDAVKYKYPDQTVTISFQWDVLLIKKQFDVLSFFKDSLDVYSFTTYPSFFKDPDKIPDEYYLSVRKLLPTERVGFSEVGWNSGSGSNEDLQAKYYARLPELMKGARPEYILLGLLHDVAAFESELGALNSVGIRHSDGKRKKSWHVVRDLDFRE